MTYCILLIFSSLCLPNVRFYLAVLRRLAFSLLQCYNNSTENKRKVGTIKWDSYPQGTIRNRTTHICSEGNAMIAQTARKELPACPVETTLTLIGDKWKVLILRDLLTGTKRFGELKRSLGSVSQKVLTAQLRDMENSGLINRTVYPEVPPRVEYSLTELGQSLKPILDALQSWGLEYKAMLKE